MAAQAGAGAHPAALLCCLPSRQSVNPDLCKTAVSSLLPHLGGKRHRLYRIPQKLWQGSEPVDGSVVKDGWLMNRYDPSPEMHEDAAARLAVACSRYLPATQDMRRRRKAG